MSSLTQQSGESALARQTERSCSHGCAIRHRPRPPGFSVTQECGLAGPPWPAEW